MLDQSTQWYKLQYPECFVAEDQRMLQQTVANLVDKEIMPIRHKIDDDNHEEYVTPILQKLQVDIGFQSGIIPKDYGGTEDLRLTSGALRQEQLSRADYGIALASACVDWGIAPASIAYLFHPAPEAKAWGKAIFDEFAKNFVSDKLYIPCFNMSEPDSATDIENETNEGRLVRTKAELKGNEWVINGTKHWASNSGIANLHCVVCNQDPKQGIDKFTLIYCPEPWPGVSHGQYEIKCGIKGDRNTSTFFDNARVPKEWGIQGPVAWEIFENNVVSAWAMQVANITGILEGALDVMIDITGQRTVGGKLIRDHSSTAQFIGEMVAAMSVARGTYLLMCHEFDHMEIYGSWITDSMIAKARSTLSFMSRMANDVISRGMEYLGSNGYVLEAHYEKYYREIAGLKLLLGGVQLGFFAGCRQYYDFNFSSFGPGKLQR